jgi:hypothetical protein
MVIPFSTAFAQSQASIAAAKFAGIARTQLTIGA